MFGLALFNLGRGVTGGRSEIRITRDKLQAVERLGFWRFKRSRPIDKLRGFEVIHAPKDSLTSSRVQGKGSVQAIQFLSNLAAIKANSEGAKAMILAPGYPLELARELADHLAGRIDRQLDRKLVRDPDQPQLTVTVTDNAMGIEKLQNVIKATFSRTPADDDLFEQPADSKIVFEPIDGGVSLRVPPAGLWKGSGGLIYMAIFWLLITGVITLAMLASGDAPWLAFLFISVFWAVGVAMAVGAVRMGKRQAIIDVIGDTLLISETTGSRTKQHEWTVDQIRSIHMGPSGMEVNNKPVMQLQIDPIEGKKLGIFTNRDRDELRWLATTLRQALGLGRSDPGDAPTDAQIGSDAINSEADVYTSESD